MELVPLEYRVYYPGCSTFSGQWVRIVRSHLNSDKWQVRTEQDTPWTICKVSDNSYPWRTAENNFGTRFDSAEEALEALKEAW